GGLVVLCQLGVLPAQLVRAFGDVVRGWPHDEGNLHDTCRSGSLKMRKVESSRGERQTEAPVALGFGKLQSFKNELKHDRRYGLAFGCGAKVELPAFHALVVEAESGRIPKEHLDLVAGLVEKAKQMAGKSVHAQAVFHQGRQAIDAFEI